MLVSLRAFPSIQVSSDREGAILSSFCSLTASAVALGSSLIRSWNMTTTRTKLDHERVHPSANQQQHRLLDPSRYLMSYCGIQLLGKIVRHIIYCSGNTGEIMSDKVTVAGPHAREQQAGDSRRPSNRDSNRFLALNSQGWYWCVALGQPRSHVNADHPSLKIVPVLALLIVHVCTILPRMGMWGNNR